MIWITFVIIALIKDYNIYKRFVHRNHVKVWCNDKNPMHRFEIVEKGYRQRILSLPGAREIRNDNWVVLPDIQVDWIDGFHPQCIGEPLRIAIFEETTILNIFDRHVWPFIAPIKVLLLLFRGL